MVHCHWFPDITKGSRWSCRPVTLAFIDPSYTLARPLQFIALHKIQLLLPCLTSLLDSPSPLQRMWLLFLSFWPSVEPHTLWAELHYNHLNLIIDIVLGDWLILGCLFAQFSFFYSHCASVLRSRIMITKCLKFFLRHSLGLPQLSRNTAHLTGRCSPFLGMGPFHENLCPWGSMNWEFRDDVTEASLTEPSHSHVQSHTRLLSI